MIRFPKEFLWGAATSSYQVEGNNSNCDWWEWEKRKKIEPSGDACRHYQFYEQDFDLAKELHHNCHRLSLEWSRIEPQEGNFLDSEIAHYRSVIQALRVRGLEPVVTLHHFTNPLWFSRRGGWKQKSSPDIFLRYVERIVSVLAQDVHFWVTINEPLVYTYHAYIIGQWPPQERSFRSAKIASNNLALAHIRAYQKIHEIYQQKKLTSPMVSIAKNIQVFEPCVPSFRNSFSAYIRDRSFNYELLEKLIRNHSLDYIGINYYTRNLVELRGWGFSNFMLDVCRNNHSDLKKNSLGWDLYPKGLYDLLMRLKRFGLPIFILENGICTEDDSLRKEFIAGHLRAVGHALAQGVNLLGYLYWSLLDNFEWDKGFAPRFGLIEVDYKTYKRTIRESARMFAGVCDTGILPDQWKP